MGVQHANSFVVFLLAVYGSLTVRRVTAKDYKLGVLLPYANNIRNQYEVGTFRAEYYASAITLAIDKVNNDPSLLPGSTLSFVWNNTQCSRTKMVMHQHWQIKQGVSGFIGPVCHARKAARIAKKHKLAVVSYGSQDRVVSNKRQYPNFARTNPADYKGVPKIVELVKMKGWKRVTIVYEPNQLWSFSGKYLVKNLRREGITITRRIKIQPYYGISNFPTKTAVKAINSVSEATIFLLRFGQVREIMSTLQSENLLDQNPEYGFIAMDFDMPSVANRIKYPFKWYFSFLDGARRMNVTKKALKRLLLVAYKPRYDDDSKEYVAFMEELKRVIALEPFNSKVYQGCVKSRGRCFYSRSSLKVPRSAAYLYNAVIQFAKALHELEEAGKRPSGVEIVNKLRGRHFTSIDGHKYEFDENADVKYDFAVLGPKQDSDGESNMLPLTDEEIMKG